MEKIFFIGICGVSMSALAVLAKSKGNEVLGIDKNFNRCPKILAENAIEVFDENDFSSLEGCDIVVYSSAIREDNDALLFARKLNKKIKTRGEFLGEIASEYEKTIAVAGSHGKTTTTAMIYHCLEVAGKRPTLHLGGNLVLEKSNAILGGNEFFVTEACEYYDNFLHLFPYIAVVTNLEKEHLDYFKTFANEKRSFDKFKSQSKYVIDKLIYEPKNIRINKFGGVSFDICFNGEKITKINLKIGGFYNAINAIFAFEVCKKLGLKNDLIKLGLETFLGTEKRLEKKSYLGKEIIVDYAHHPTEIENARKFLKRLKKRVNLVFQPHTFSRTEEFKKEFIKVLEKFENIILYKTYPAREKPEDGLSAFELSKIVRNAKYFEYEKDVIDLILNQKEDEITVIMGAGDLPEKLGIY